MIEINDLHFSYGNNRPILKNITLNIRQGEFVAVLGANGSGKSTLAKHLNALLLPIAGKVLIDGIDTSDPATTQTIRSRVGMVFQNPDNQLVATIVEDDVAFAPENLGIPPQEIRLRVDRALKAVGMYGHRLKAPHMLSGGQKQRVAIAGVLAMQPSYLVLDEPTAMLDPVGRRECMQTIMRLNKENGMTIVLITHYMEEAANAQRIIVLRDGELYLDDTPGQVFSQTLKLNDAGLEVPQTTGLLNILKNEGVDVVTNVFSVEECVGELLKVAKRGGGVGEI